jgi:hypothetical protein
MKSFDTSIVIQSSAEAIWSILTDAAHWTEWNPTINKIEGHIAPGEKVTVHTKINPGRSFPVKVAEFVPKQKMVWIGGMPLGLFKGERTYSLTPAGDGLVEFRMHEVFSGLLAPLIEKSIPNLQPAFDEFATALKVRAEKVQ